MTGKKKKPELPEAVARKMEEAAAQRSGGNPATPEPHGDEPPAHLLADIEPDPAAVEYCAEFDHSDTDNGKRLVTHFGTDIVVIAQEKAQRANDDGGGACVLDAEVMGSPIRYAGLAWKRVQSWEKMTPEKFREYKKLASLAKGKAKDSQTKLACKMWAKTGAKTR